MRYLLAALLLITAGTVVGMGVTVGASNTAAEVVSQTTLVFQIDWLVNLLDRIDRLLETIVDLLNTLQQLSGEGGE